MSSPSPPPSATSSPELQRSELSYPPKPPSAIRRRSKTPLSDISTSIQDLGQTLSSGIKKTLSDAAAGELPLGIEIKFAPLKVPRHRRLQTAAVAFWSTMLPICMGAFFLACSMPILWPILIPYLIWIFKIDTAPDFGGRPKMWLKRCSLWVHFANYYPASLIKEVDLPPDRPYIFGYHPHGIISQGAFANYATEGTGFSKAFPGIRPHLLTLSSNFRIPFYRDILLLLGVASVSKRSCSNILRKGPGEAIVIVVGGASESLRAHPNTADLTLKKRMGFIKIAIREGADLVPVFSFGENDIYDQLANERGTTIYKIQKGFQAVFGFSLPMFHGRGLFNYSIGLMPYRHPIVSVVGHPITVTQNDNPTETELVETQARYIEELLSIWEKYKDVYARNRTRELTLVD